MTAESARAALEAAIAAGPESLENYVLRGDSLSDAKVRRFDLVREMANEVMQDVLGAAERMARKQLLSYDPSYQTSSSQVLVEKLADIPELAKIDSSIRGGDTPDDNGGTGLIAMVHAVNTSAGRIVAYRLKGAGIATRRSRGITLLPRNGIYRPISGDLLYYEPLFDTLTIEEVALFNTVTLVQSKLHAPGKARELANKTLKSITAKIRIDGYDDLEKAVMDDPTLRAKMAYVARRLERHPDYLSHLTTKKLVEFAQRNPEYNIPTTTVGGKKALKFESSPQHRHKIPRLLADDFLHSYLTETNYEAGSKQATT